MLNFDIDFLIHTFKNINSLGKITIFLISWAVIWLPIVLPILWFNKWQKSAPNPNITKLTLILSLYSITPILAWVVIKVEKISLQDIGIIWQASPFQSILFGYCLSIASLLCVYGTQWAMNWLIWKDKPIFNFDFVITVISLFVVSFMIGSIEEFVFRGIIVYFLRVDYSIWITAIISSAIFALLHLIWEQKNTIPQLPGLWLMGLVLFYACIFNNGNLGLAIGLHSGWVLILACVDTFDLYSYNPDFLDWLVGKKDQPLGSVMGLMVLFLTMIVLLLMNNWSLHY